MRAVLLMTLLVGLPACGGTTQRAPMPDVTGTDQTADEMGLPSAEPAAGTEVDSAADEPSPDATTDQVD